MAAKPVQVSIDQLLLAQIDADPETQTRGRSAFVRSAVQRYLAVKQRRQIDAQIAAAYRGTDDRELSDAAGLIEAQEWPDD